MTSFKIVMFLVVSTILALFVLVSLNFYISNKKNVQDPKASPLEQNILGIGKFNVTDDKTNLYVNATFKSVEIKNGKVISTVEIKGPNDKILKRNVVILIEKNGNEFYLKKLADINDPANYRIVTIKTAEDTRKSLINYLDKPVKLSVPLSPSISQGLPAQYKSYTPCNDNLYESLKKEKTLKNCDIFSGELTFYDKNN